MEDKLKLAEQMLKERREFNKLLTDRVNESELLIEKWRKAIAENEKIMNQIESDINLVKAVLN